MSITTKFWTWTQIKEKIESECDLEEESFIDEDELMAFANDAIDEAEAQIHSLYEDYFLSRSTITLVNGTDSYSMPTTIYAHKIRGLMYYNGSKIYEIKRIRDWKKFQQYRLARYNSSNTEEYRYFIENGTAGTPKIVLSPPAYEAGQYVEIWFIRQANRLTTGADVCDIPEFIQFIFNYLRERVAYKEAAGSPKHVSAKADLDASREDMVATLQTMVPDGDNEIEPNMSHYEEMV